MTAARVTGSIVIKIIEAQFYFASSNLTVVVFSVPCSDILTLYRSLLDQFYSREHSHIRATYQNTSLVRREDDVDLRLALWLGLQFFQHHCSEVRGLCTAVAFLAHFQFHGALTVLRR